MWGKNRVDPFDVVNMCNQFLIVHLLKKIKSFQARGLSKNAMVYRNAISSIKKYPLPIISKAQLESLNGIGQFLSQQLQKAIKKHYSAYLTENLQQKNRCQKKNAQNYSSFEECSQSKKDYINNNRIQLEDETLIQESKSTKSATVSYKPRVNTANAYFLQCLRLLTYKKSQITLFGISRQQLEKEVQAKYPLAKNKTWKGIEQTLESNGLIIIERNKQEAGKKQKVVYKLTQKGETCAQYLDEKSKKSEIRSKIMDQVKTFRTDINSKKSTNKVIQQDLNSISQMQDSLQFQSKLTRKILSLTQEQFDPSKFYLIVDSRQKKQKTQINFFVQKLTHKYGINCKSASLSIGDFLWIYDNKVLDFIIQRKIADDLAASIMDGRYKDQKYRLKNSGISNVYYFYQGYPSDSCCQPEKTLLNALLKTRVKQQFKVYQTTDINQTMKLLYALHQQIFQKLLLNKISYVCTLEQFIQFNSIQKNSTVQKTFALGLMTIPGVGKNAINKMIQFFKTYRTMHDYLLRFSSISQKEQFLKNLFKGSGMMSSLPKILASLLFSNNYKQIEYKQSLIQRKIQIQQTEEVIKRQNNGLFKQQRIFSIIREENESYEEQYNI